MDIQEGSNGEKDPADKMAKIAVSNQALRQDVNVTANTPSTEISAWDNPNASFWDLFREQIRNDFAPFIMVIRFLYGRVPAPVRAMVNDQIDIVRNPAIKIYSNLRDHSSNLKEPLQNIAVGVAAPMCTVAGKVLRLVGGAIVSTGDGMKMLGDSIKDRNKERNKSNSKEWVSVSPALNSKGGRGGGQFGETLEDVPTGYEASAVPSVNKSKEEGEESEILGDRGKGKESIIDQEDYLDEGEKENWRHFNDDEDDEDVEIINL